MLEGYDCISQHDLRPRNYKNDNYNEDDDVSEEDDGCNGKK